MFVNVLLLYKNLLIRHEGTSLTAGYFLLLGECLLKSKQIIKLIITLICKEKMLQIHATVSCEIYTQMPVNHTKLNKL